MDNLSLLKKKVNEEAVSEPVDLAVLAGDRKWPDDVASEAYHGPLGELIRAIERDTEADPHALLFQSLCFVGAIVGRGCWFLIEDLKHYLVLFCLIVGKTSRARKGTSYGRIKKIFNEIDPEFVANNLVSGLSSGEGLVHLVRDPIKELTTDDFGIKKETIVDPGVLDKRRLVMEGEWATALTSAGRDGNKLSPIIRDLWDSSNLQILTKNNPINATDPHICIIGHITIEELLLKTTSNDITGGFGNRFLPVASEKKRNLPLGRSLDLDRIRPILDKIRQGIEFGKKAGMLSFDENAVVEYGSFYESIDDSRGGVFGALTARAEAMVPRLSCFYAIMDCSNVIRSEHLRAAIALWDYCEASVKCIYGTKTGNKSADRIVDELKLTTHGLTQTEIIRDIFKNNTSKNEIALALKVLKDSGQILEIKGRSDDEGRTIKKWVLREYSHSTTNEFNELNDLSREPKVVNSLNS